MQSDLFNSFFFNVRILFQQALVDFRVELVEDPIIKAHLESLYDTMLEQNLCRIIEPYSRVQVSHSSPN